LGRLPWRQRAAIVLRYFVDVPDHEIAEFLACRPSTVRSLIRRGVANLREVLE
jgi:DNA-directed RNA polymerase specialized sigma24 family protein